MTIFVCWSLKKKNIANHTELTELILGYSPTNVSVNRDHSSEGLPKYCNFYLIT